MTDDLKLLALLHAALCGAIAWACLCRVNRMQACTTRQTVRWAYSVLMTVALAAGSAPLWAGWMWAVWSSIGLAGGFLLVMWVNSPAWRLGLPPHACSAPDTFDSLPHDHWPRVVGRGKDAP